MAQVREDKVQLRLDFITDESGAFAKTIEQTKKFNNDIATTQKEIEKLEKEIAKMEEKDLSTIGTKQKLVEAQKRLTEAINGSVRSGQSLANLDLKNVAPDALGQRLRQINDQLKHIPENIRASHPEAIALKNEADRIKAALDGVRGKAREIAPEINAARKEMSGWGQAMSTAFGIFLGGGLLGAVNNVFGRLKGFASIGLNAVDSFEQAKIAFETMIGSATKANELIAEIVKKAAKTPFEQSELIDYAKRLLAMGIETEKILPTMDALGNIAAGVGKEKLPQLVLAFGQVSTKTKLAGGEIKQFTEAGVPLIQALADQFGKTGKEILKMSEAGEIGFKDVEKAIFAMSQEGGKFYNLMAKQATTLGGVMSTLKDNFQIFAKNVFTGIAEYLKPVAEGFSKFFDNFNKAFEDITPKMTVLRQETDKERTALNLAVESVTKYNIGSTERKTAIEALKKIHPSFMKDLNVETATNAQLRDRLQEVNQQYQAKIIAIAAGKKVEEALNKEKSTQEAIGKDRLRQADNIVKAREYLNDYTSSVDVLVQKLRTEFQNSSYFSKHRQEAKDLIFSLQNYKEQNISLSIIEGKYSERTVAAKKREKQVIDELKKQYPEIAAQLDLIAKAAEGTTEATKKTTTAIAEATDGKAEKKQLQRLKEQHAVNLGEAEIFWDTELLMQTVALSKKEMSKAEYSEQELIIETLKYENLLAIQTAYLAKLEKGTKEYVTTQKEMLELGEKIAKNNGILNRAPVEEVAKLGKKGVTTEGVKSDDLTKDKTLKSIQDNADIEKGLVRQKFGDLLTLETEFELKRLAIQKNAYADQRAELEKLYTNKTISSEEYAKKYWQIAENEKKTDEDVVKNKQLLLETERAMAQAKDEIEQAKKGAALDAFDVAIDLLSRDEAARKKNGAAIKAFQIGQVVTSGIFEVQNIWATWQQPQYGPAGPIVAGILTALAVGRSVAAVNKINAAKFAKGGIMQTLGGQSHANGGTKGYFDDGTQVEMERGEVLTVVNAKNAPMLKMLSKINSLGGNGTPYFENGGLLLPNTTPNPANFFTPQYATAAPISAEKSMSDAILYKMLAKFDSLEKAVEKNREVKFYRNKLEDAYASDEEDRDTVRWKL